MRRAEDANGILSGEALIGKKTIHLISACYNELRSV